MSSRKPPSQRPERQQDDVSRAIARLNERPAAPADGEPKRTDRPASRPTGRPGGAPTRKVDAGPVYPSTKKPKTG